MEDAILESAICPLCGHPKRHGARVCDRCSTVCDCGKKKRAGDSQCDDCIAESMGYKRERREPVRGGGEYADASLVTD